VELAETQREIAQQERQLKSSPTTSSGGGQPARDAPTRRPTKRYLKKFDDQETVIEQFQAKIQAAAGRRHAQKKSYDDFLANLNATDRPPPSPSGEGEQETGPPLSGAGGSLLRELWGSRQDTPPPCAASREVGQFSGLTNRCRTPICASSRRCGRRGRPT